MKRGNKKSIVIETTYGVHTIILEPDEKKGYIVTVPGLEGVITWGKNIVHAKIMAQEAIECCIESLVMRHVRGGRNSMAYQKRTARGLVSIGV